MGASLAWRAWAGCTRPLFAHHRQQHRRLASAVPQCRPSAAVQAIVAHRRQPREHGGLVPVDKPALARHVERALVAEGVVLDHVVDRHARMVVVDVDLREKLERGGSNSNKSWLANQLRVSRAVRRLLVVQALELGSEAPWGLRGSGDVAAAVVGAVVGHPVHAAVVESDIQVVVEKDVRVDSVPSPAAKQHPSRGVDHPAPKQRRLSERPRASQSATADNAAAHVLP